LDRQILRYYPAVVAVSGDVSTRLQRSGVPAERITLIPNGVSLDLFEKRGDGRLLREELGLPPESAVVAVIGRLSAEKGQALLLGAARQLVRDFPEVRFLLVGDGPLRGRLEQLTEELGLASRVLFTGTRDDVHRIFSLSDCLVIPSLREGLPMVLLEAMASQTPVVATTVGDIPSVVEHGVSGLLVAPSDVPSLAEAIRTILRDPARARTLAEAGRARVSESYSPWVWRSLGWLLVAGVCVGSLVPGQVVAAMHVQDKLLHVSSYCVLMVWFGGICTRHFIIADVVGVLIGLALSRDSASVHSSQLFSRSP
jgi:glycosyltransferase involved in cell wall biosynthesis